MTQTDQWNPTQYNRYRNERMQPFFDLVAQIKPKDGMRAIDLGCGTGELTAMLAERLTDAMVEGIDSSPAMLKQAAPRETDRVRFRLQEIADLDDASAYDLVFSNAALQWVPDNEALVGRILATLPPGGQIAVQVPRNEEHASHRLAAEVASAAPYRNLLGGYIRESHVLPLKRYAELLYRHGCREQLCIEKIYGHELPSSDDVVEWVKGTSLGAYLNRLEEPARGAFLAEYRRRLIAEIGDHRPYFYPFRRLLFWGVKQG